MRFLLPIYLYQTDETLLSCAKELTTKPYNISVYPLDMSYPVIDSQLSYICVYSSPPCALNIELISSFFYSFSKTEYKHNRKREYSVKTRTCSPGFSHCLYDDYVILGMYHVVPRLAEGFPLGDLPPRNVHSQKLVMASVLSVRYAIFIFDQKLTTSRQVLAKTYQHQIL